MVEKGTTKEGEEKKGKENANKKETENRGEIAVFISGCPRMFFCALLF